MLKQTVHNSSQPHWSESLCGGIDEYIECYKDGNLLFDFGWWYIRDNYPNRLTEHQKTSLKELCNNFILDMKTCIDNVPSTKDKSLYLYMLELEQTTAMCNLMGLTRKFYWSISEGICYNGLEWALCYDELDSKFGSVQCTVLGGYIRLDILNKLGVISTLQDMIEKCYEIFKGN